MSNKPMWIRAAFLIGLAVIASLAFRASIASAQSGARVYLQPVDSPEGTLTVEVMAENVTNLYGAEFKLRYDPQVLSAQDLKADQEGVQVEAGTLLAVDQGFVVANKADDADGSVIFAMTLLNPAPPVNGSGPLARASFKVLQNAPSAISLEKAKLVAFDLQTISVEMVSLPINGGTVNDLPDVTTQEAAVAPSATDPAPAATPVVASPAAPATTSESSFPWWIVAAGVIILGVVGLGAFIVAGGRKKPQQAAAKAQIRPQTTTAQPAQQPSKPAEQPRRTGPSAFK